MNIPRDLSGDELLAALCRHWGYSKIHQVGSHIILQTQNPRRTVLLFPHTKRCGSER